MAENLLSNRADRGRTFTIAMWVVGFVLSLEVLLAGWALIARPEVVRSGFASSGGEGVPIYLPPSQISGAVSGADPVAAVSPGSESLSLEGESGDVPGRSDEGSVAPPRIDPASPAPSETLSGEMLTELNMALAAALETAPPIPDSILARLVDTAEELREAGNMQGALQPLLQAEAGVPDHPRILSQLAATYLQMGVTETADDYWQKVLSLGPGAAGPYFSIADRVTRGESPAGEAPDPEASAPEALEEPEAGVDPVLSIGEVKVDEQAPGDAGQRVSLRVVVDAIDGRTHAGEDLALFVFFYDLVNGNQILESTADTSYLYPTEPYDWAVNGREEIVVNYNQPQFTPGEAAELGTREYYGYAIQLYYRDALQDSVVMPSEISKLRLEPAEPTAPPGGIRGGAQPDRIGPENALFPPTSDL